MLALLVKDYDEAIEFYTRKLDFELIEDTRLSDIKRWVVIRPSGYERNGASLLLAKAASEEQLKQVGHQTGGRVFLFLHTDHLERDYIRLQEKGVTIVREPSKETYGKVLVFSDLYGNLWDLIEPPSLNSND